MAVRKAGASKRGSRKPAAKKTVRKTAAKKAVAKKAARKAVAKKAAKKKAPAKKAPAKKAPAKKAATRKSAAKKAVARKAATKASAPRKSAAKKSVARKAPARKSATKKSTARKSTVKKSTARKASVKRTTRAAARKPVPKKTARATSGKARASKTSTRKPAPRAPVKSAPKKTSTASTAPAKLKPQAGAAGTPMAAPARKPSREAARRLPAHRAPTSREKAARKVAVRTAIGGENAPPTSARAKPEKSGAPPVSIKADLGPRYDEILTPEALEFLGALHAQFDARRHRLLVRRLERQARFDAGVFPDFLHETRHVRASGWRVGPLPADLLDRRVEITGPVDRKMIINALNSGAKVFMADFEDATSPTFANMVEGQINLKDRWAGALSFQDTETGRDYVLGPDPAVLMVRPRGWHLPEAHALIGGVEMSGALFDFGLYAFHNAKAQIEQGATPAFYLPKLESHLEARLWSDILIFTEKTLGLERGTLKVTVLIETLPAAFEMDEIIFELREHIAGLNCGRWDYIFSTIKRMGRHARFLTPDRSRMVMGEAFLHAYSQLLIKTCHRRGVLAMGGIAAQIPVRGNTALNEEAFAKVRADKEREARNGHDGTWVAHPDLVPVAKEVFDRLMPGENQLDVAGHDIEVGRDDLLQMHAGPRTLAGLRENIRVGISYIAAWLGGRGAVPLNNLMEDAATAEISRVQVWQWLQHEARIEGLGPLTRAQLEALLTSEVASLRGESGANPAVSTRLDDAAALFIDLVLAADCEEFFTSAAYRLLEN